MDKKEHLLNQIIEKNQDSFSEKELEQIRLAYDFAVKSHDGQMRKDGDEFVCHPLSVANILSDMELDAQSVVASMLHDCVEDTAATLNVIKEKFGKEIAGLVDGVTKLGRIPYSNKEEQQMENLRKMFLAMAKDIRVIFIKLADRLHNLRTIAALPEEKQREKALETMEVYAPLAHRLGIYKIKLELEDLSLKYLDPVGYNDITESLKAKSTESNLLLDAVKTKIRDRLVEIGIESRIDTRVKHIYSIYMKMYSQNKIIDEVYDLYAVRVIVETVIDCYNVMGIIHDLFKPIPGRFKDYISTPKPNMYQSLHTTVIGREGMPFEVQIRTWDMHYTAEYGIAAHWKYKTKTSGKNSMDERLAWVRQLLENQQETDSQEFFKSLKVDMLSDEVFVFTPKGDVVNLPAGATIIDFAYSIHSAVGNRMVGAKVDGRIVQLDYEVKNGEIIEILTTSSTKGPSRDWLNIAKTNEAKSKIRQWFKKERYEENVVEGQKALETELKKHGISPAQIGDNEIAEQILKRLHFKTMPDLYSAIGYGGLSAQRAANRIKEEVSRNGKLSKEALRILEKMDDLPKTKQMPSSGVIIEGVDNVLIKFARCCSPLPGDDIIGFVTRGYGVSIHKTDCVNVVNAMKKQEDSERWIPVLWGDEILGKFSGSLCITSEDRVGLLADVATVLANMKVTIRSINANDIKDGTAVLNVVLETTDRENMEAIMKKLMTIRGVSEVRRCSM